MRLEGKTAVITGSGQGIGLAMAERFIQEGAKVAIAEISEERGKAAAESLSQNGEAEFFKVDVSDETSTQELAAAVERRFGSIDILVNNAALYYDLDIMNTSLDYFRRVMDVNFFGTWLCARAVAPGMVARGSGRIINMSSDAAYMHLSAMAPEFQEVGSFAYHLSKFSVNGLTKFVAAQLGGHGVNVNAIAPGVTMTEATRKVMPQEMLDMVVMMTPMHQTLQPSDLAGAAVFLASDDARYVTGQILCVDGGMQMPA